MTTSTSYRFIATAPDGAQLVRSSRTRAYSHAIIFAAAAAASWRLASCHSSEDLARKALGSLSPSRRETARIVPLETVAKTVARMDEDRRRRSLATRRLNEARRAVARREAEVADRVATTVADYRAKWTFARGEGDDEVERRIARDLENARRRLDDARRWLARCEAEAAAAGSAAAAG
jgi:hypothetical protein